MKKNARKSPKNEASKILLRSRQLTIPLPEQVAEELYGVVTRLGLLALQSMLLSEVEDLCGPRYTRGQGDRPSRNGTTAGSLALGGRRVEVRRPRVRRDGREVPLATWENVASEDPLNRRAVEQMLIGVSTRKYERSLEKVPEDVKTRGTSRSAVSRRFVAMTEAEQGAKLAMNTSSSSGVLGLALRSLLAGGARAAVNQRDPVLKL